MPLMATYWARVVASMRQTEALASVIFFSFSTLNTKEENLTMDITSVITIDIASVIFFFLATAH